LSPERSRLYGGLGLLVLCAAVAAGCQRIGEGGIRVARCQAVARRSRSYNSLMYFRSTLVRKGRVRLGAVKLCPSSRATRRIPSHDSESTAITRNKPTSCFLEVDAIRESWSGLRAGQPTNRCAVRTSVRGVDGPRRQGHGEQAPGPAPAPDGSSIRGVGRGPRRQGSESAGPGAR